MKSNPNKNENIKRPHSSKVKSLNERINSPNKKENNFKSFPKFNNSLNRPSSQIQKLNKNNDSKSEFNDSNDFKGDALKEEYKIIQKVWEDLGVTLKYRVQFNNYIKTISESSLKNIFHYEKYYLKRFKDSLVKLNKEIIARENNIRSLKKYIFILQNSGNYFENEEDMKQKRSKDSSISKIVLIIKSLRLNSVNVIKHFLKVREISTYYFSVKKIDMKAISEDYNYDENYLKKMKDDMTFLKEYQILQKYFIVNNGEIDAFLTNFSPKNNSNENYSKINSNKVRIPVSDELNKFINHSRYILIQESFFDSMRNRGNQINSIRGESNDMHDLNNNNNSSKFNKNNKKKISFKIKSYTQHNSTNQFFEVDENNNNLGKKKKKK